MFVSQISWCNGRDISWRHLEKLYQNDKGADRQAPGLAMVPKLKYEHLHLTSFSKMRVDLAAQVVYMYKYTCTYFHIHVHTVL